MEMVSVFFYYFKIVQKLLIVHSCKYSKVVLLGLFDKLKKKKSAKIPIKELEAPPVLEEQSQSLQAAPEFLLPQQSRELPVQPVAFGEMPDDVPIPMPPDEMQAPPSLQVPEKPVIPKFRFYENAEPREITAPIISTTPESAQQQMPFDVAQELLTIPKQVPKQHIPQPEKYKEEEEELEKPYTFLPEQKESQVIAVKKQPEHYPKSFLTVASLFEVGEQLINLKEDILLGRDTLFRLIDLNEQEIELVAKWQVLQQSIEMRVAEIDKLLFKA